VLTHEYCHAHGSGRSIAGFHLLDALTFVHEIDSLFTRFGGHSHAVGFSLPSDRVEILRSRMRAYGARLLSESMLAPPLECDSEISFSDITPELFDWLTQCGPFGMENREPVFVSRRVTLLADIRLIKEKHVCLVLHQGNESVRFTALGWSRGTDWSARCTEMGLRKGAVVDIAFRLRAKTNPQYPGLELELLDIRLT